VQYGLFPPNFGDYGDPNVLRELARRAEAAGWDGFFVWDHLLGELPVADPWVALAAIAAETRSLVLGPMIVPLARRRPWKVALEAATLDALAPGRVIVGVGIGVRWDYARFGEPDDAAERVEKVEDGMALLRRLLAGETVNHHGSHHRVSDVTFQRAAVPLWASGFWPRRRPVVGARHADGVFPNVREPVTGFRRPTPAEVREQRRDFVADGGPADGAVAVMSLTSSEPADLEAYAAAGATWWLESPWTGKQGFVPPEQYAAHVDAGPPGRR
jgi:alkanesulfonate monooxygenase SsuD/methylene tetrahydromethanopterin reductase-like flavin-dependent oxidoreductase (luciferase family)